MTARDLGEAECPACVASRRSTVDAFFLGFRAGFRNSVVAHIEGKGEVSNREAVRFCLAHDRMKTEAYADEIRESMGLPRVGGAEEG